MEEVEKRIQQGVDLKQTPGIVLIATNADGKSNIVISKNSPLNGIPGSLEYSSSFHHASDSELSPDSTYWIASCTKLMTTIAPLQCIERGLFSLDSICLGL